MTPSFPKAMTITTRANTPSEGEGWSAWPADIPAAGTGRTEADALRSLAELLADFVRGHKQTIDRMRAVCHDLAHPTPEVDEAPVGKTAGEYPKQPPSIPTVVLEACARAAHEANRAYCVAIADAPHGTWDEVSAAQHASIVHGVQQVIAGKDPEAMHAEWMRYKLERGWVLGATKSEEDRTHPNLRPYNQLPPAQQAKDSLFVDTVRAVLRAHAIYVASVLGA